MEQQNSPNYKSKESKAENLNSEKMRIFTISDLYWEKYWSIIDQAKDHIFLVTYDFDNKTIANNTLIKLIKALERGVPVCLIVEHLNFYLNYILLKEFKNKGGVVINPNQLHLIFKHIQNGQLKRFFNRYHQKVTLIDQNLFLGSINIAEEYSGVKYGSHKFIDINLYIKNTVCFKKVLYFFREIIDFEVHQIKSLKIKNRFYRVFEKNGIKAQMDFHESLNDISYEYFLEELPPKKSEIQDNLYDLLETAEESIIVIQAYYSNMERIEKLLIRAAKRGVKVTIITADKRDQVAYKYQYNSDLFKILMENGIEVNEYMDKYLHMKAYYIDRKYLSTGSLNNDKTSFILNGEANYLIKRNSFNEKLFEDFENVVVDIKKNCRITAMVQKKNFLRSTLSNWWNFFIWCMETTVPNRDYRYIMSFNYKLKNVKNVNKFSFKNSKNNKN
jgi:cardiolipin synthase